ncbi:hypothetical protein PMAYCL1PPCAC_07822, partial [Pristionchus mayeri]
MKNTGIRSDNARVFSLSLAHILLLPSLNRCLQPIITAHLQLSSRSSDNAGYYHDLLGTDPNDDLITPRTITAHPQFSARRSDNAGYYNKNNRNRKTSDGQITPVRITIPLQQPLPRR